MYLDHAAATPCDKLVLEAMQPFFSDHFFNPSSPYAPAVAVRRQYDEAKHKIAMTIGAKPNDCIVTAGATESINLAMTAAADGHILTSEIEHHAVLAAVKRYAHTIIEPTPKGSVDLKKLEDSIKSGTKLITIALANNELGTIQPLGKIVEIVKHERDRRRQNGNATPLWLHCDASQGFGQIDCNLARLEVDLLTLNSGKIYGPKQVGLLWRRASVPLNALIVGGGQELGLRSGTENVAGVVGFSVAIDRAERHRKTESKRLMELRSVIENGLQQAFPDMQITGDRKRRLPGALHVSFPGLDAERLVFRLESRQVFVATGSACAANKGSASHVLQALGLDNQYISGSLRITLGKLNDLSSVQKALSIIIEEVNSEYQRVSK